MEADAVRRQLHPEGVVSYTIDRLITCVGASTDGQFETMCAEIEGTLAMGGTGVTLGVETSAGLTIEWFESLLAKAKRRFPAVWLHGFSASEIRAVAERSGLTVSDTIVRLRDAGLDSIPGDDAGILGDKAQDWISVHRAAHKLGVRSTATMIFGGGETIEQRVNHLEAVRRLQEETGGFAAFTPSSARNKARELDEATAVEYLKTLAISRMYLDNIENVQGHLETQGLKVLQMSLRFGGNDVGSVLSAGVNAATEENLRQVIRDAGFKPVQRDTLYRTMFLN